MWQLLHIAGIYIYIRKYMSCIYCDIHTYIDSDIYIYILYIYIRIVRSHHISAKSPGQLIYIFRPIFWVTYIFIAFVISSE